MTMSVEAAAQAMREAMRETVRRYSLWYLIQGALMVLGGILALVYPIVSSVALVLFLGWILIVSGVVQGISLIGARHVPNFWLQLISVVLSLIIGLLFLSAPGRGSFYLYAASDRVLHGRGLFKGDFFADDTAVSKLGMGLSKWRCGNTAIFLSLGQSFSNGDLAAWCVARDSAH
jgi:hypothetical protein